MYVQWLGKETGCEDVCLLLNLQWCAIGYWVNNLILCFFLSTCKILVIICNYAQACCKAYFPDGKDAIDKPSICYFKHLYRRKLKLRNAQFTVSSTPYIYFFVCKENQAKLENASSFFPGLLAYFLGDFCITHGCISLAQQPVLIKWHLALHLGHCNLCGLKWFGLSRPFWLCSVC